MPPVTVRRGRRDDLDLIDAIEQEVFDSDLLSRRSLRRFLSVASTDTFVAARGAVIGGYAMIGFRRDSRAGRLFSLAVLGSMARSGLGRALLAACEDAAWQRGCDCVRLEVRADNGAAITLYERAGYAATGRYEAFYEDGQTALLYAKARDTA